MNRRLGEFIFPYNERKFYPLVDDKLQTYELAKIVGIPQPEMYFAIEHNGDLADLQNKISSLKDFVIKPSGGAQGNGILIVNAIISAKKPGETIMFDTSRGLMGEKNLKQHISNILSGLYSLDNLPDKAIFQEKLNTPPSLQKYCFKGIPDVRIITFKGYPAMAMIRLPTEKSRGRANLHQGAIGCGLRLLDGTISNGIQKNQKITTHPDTNENFINFKLPFWDEILKLSIKCAEVINLGYLGIDIAIDDERGPLLIEVNARPGLAIQMANMMGLEHRLKKIGAESSERSATEKLIFSKHLEATPV